MFLLLLLLLLRLLLLLLLCRRQSGECAGWGLGRSGESGGVTRRRRLRRRGRRGLSFEWEVVPDGGPGCCWRTSLREDQLNTAPAAQFIVRRPQTAGGFAAEGWARGRSPWAGHRRLLHSRNERRRSGSTRRTSAASGGRLGARPRGRRTRAQQASGLRAEGVAEPDEPDEPVEPATCCRRPSAPSRRRVKARARPMAAAIATSRSRDAQLGRTLRPSKVSPACRWQRVSSAREPENELAAFVRPKRDSGTAQSRQPPPRSTLERL